MTVHDEKFKHAQHVAKHMGGDMDDIMTLDDEQFEKYYMNEEEDVLDPEVQELLDQLEQVEKQKETYKVESGLSKLEAGRQKILDDISWNEQLLNDPDRHYQEKLDDRREIAEYHRDLHEINKQIAEHQPSIDEFDAKISELKEEIGQHLDHFR